MKKSITLFALIATIALQSCALVFSGRKDKVAVKAKAPDNAKVFYNGEQVGTGSCTVKINKKDINSAVVEVKENGYKPQEFRFSRKLKIGAFIGDILTGGIWLIPDFLTGAIYKATPQKVTYDLPISDTQVKTDLKPGDKVSFTHGDLKDTEGEIKTVYPNRAIVLHTKKNGKQEELEVPLVNISKKQ